MDNITPAQALRHWGLGWALAKRGSLTTPCHPPPARRRPQSSAPNLLLETDNQGRGRELGSERQKCHRVGASPKLEIRDRVEEDTETEIEKRVGGREK